VAEGEPLGHGAEGAEPAGEVDGATVVGGSQFCGNDGAVVVEDDAGGIAGTVAPPNMDDGAVGVGVVVGAGEVTAPGAPPSGTALGK